MTMERMIALVVGALTLGFIALFTLALIRRSRPEGARLLRVANGCFAGAGLLLILAGAFGVGDMTMVAGGFMVLVFATGMEFAPRKR